MVKQTANTVRYSYTMDYDYSNVYGEWKILEAPNQQAMLRLIAATGLSLSMLYPLRTDMLLMYVPLVSENIPRAMLVSAAVRIAWDMEETLFLHNVWHKRTNLIMAAPELKILLQPFDRSFISERMKFSLGERPADRNFVFNASYLEIMAGLLSWGAFNIGLFGQALGAGATDA